MIRNRILRSTLTITKYLAAILPIWWIFSKIDLPGLLAAFERTAWWTFPALTITGLLLSFMQGIRWWLLIRAFEPELSLKRALNHHFTSLFYSIALPTSYAQDVLRSVLLSRESDYSVVWGATWICRILGSLVLIIFSLIGITTIDRTLVSREIFWSVLGTAVLISALMAVSFSKRTTRPVRKGIKLLLPSRMLHIPERIRDGIYAYRTKQVEFAVVLAMTIIMQLTVILSAALLIKGISGRLYLSEVMAFIPLIEIISISLPLTPNGIGIREGLTAVMFNRVGLSNEDLGIYVIGGFFLILLRLISSFPVVLHNYGKRITSPDQPPTENKSGSELLRDNPDSTPQ